MVLYVVVSCNNLLDNGDKEFLFLFSVSSHQGCSGSDLVGVSLETVVFHHTSGLYCTDGAPVRVFSGLSIHFKRKI